MGERSESDGAPPPDFLGQDTAAVVALVFDLAGICRDERDIARCAMRLGREIDRRDLAIALDEALWRLTRLSGLASAAAASGSPSSRQDVGGER
jgi:hypothetical protein